jgi:DNA (cytosine-5)-methyltransferase 1
MAQWIRRHIATRERAVNVLDLFSGIGGFSLGLERAGMRTAAFCEIEPYCRAVLAKHWPNVPCYEDIRDLSGQRLWDDGNTVSIQVICGGFPCQDISEANTAWRGLDGDRSGLWSEYARIIGDLLPGYVIVENVAALLGRGLGRVLGDLAALGYDAEWHCIPASAVGAPHERDRLWIIAHPHASKRWPLIGARIGMAWQDAVQRAGQEDTGRFTSLPAPQWLQTWREVADALGRVDDGISRGLDGYSAAANAVVPQIAELIGRAIMRAA